MLSLSNRQYFGKASGHIDPVVRIADLAVELCEEFLLLDDAVSDRFNALINL